jgi:tRNA modification GTPase
MRDASATIAAIATPPGTGGVGIIRLSGSAATKIASRLAGSVPKPRYAGFRQFKDNQQQTLDEGLLIFFPGPNSFTGEDVVEIQGHGGNVVMNLLLSRCVELGAVLAKPGEFSERAFHNNRLDLAQAEAISDLITSGSSQAARAAVRSLQGEFSAQTQALVEELIQLRMYVEAAIDFPDEEVDFLSDGHIANALVEIRSQFEHVSSHAKQGKIMRDGMTVVLAGQPNVGKSSLLNCLTGEDTAIVTHIPGTTRDVLREQINIDGMPLHIIDTAGLRDSDDQVEQEGMRRAHVEIAKADRLLLLVDIRKGLGHVDKELIENLPAGLELTLVRNKADLADYNIPAVSGVDDVIDISAKQQLGISQLREHLKAVMGFEPQTEGVFMARQRHLDALRNARQHLENSVEQLHEYAAGELVAEELRLSQAFLSEITGEFTSDDLLGRIFSSFCIGK